MTLRGKLIAAQAPLGVALVVMGLVAAVTNASLGRSSSSILKDNYRSVLAMQRMEKAIERLDSAAVTMLLGQRAPAETLASESERRFEAELEVQEGNITERGELQATRSLRAAWTRSQALFASYRREHDPAAMRAGYFRDLQPAFDDVKRGAETILALNEDAMVGKSESAKRSARLFDTIILGVAAGAFLAGVLASATLTARILRPLGILSQTARRLGEGDMEARARVGGHDETTALAREFNTMADRLARYRASSLGDLLQAQQQAQAAIDSLADPVVVFGRDGEVVGANAAAASILRVNLDSGAPLSAMDDVVRGAIERLRSAVMAGRGAQAPRGFEDAIRVASAEGELFLLPRATAVRTEEGGVVGCTVVLQDVTRLLRFDELKNNLVATVAHEFRTPLTSLRMAIHLLAEQAVAPITDKQADLLFAAREDTERLQRIVDDLLDLSRIQSGRMELHPRPVAVEGLVQEGVHPFKDVAAEKGIELRVEVLPGQGEVEADPERLALVFSNLIGNALRYTPRGGTVVVRARRADTHVRFEVADTGPGVPAEHQQAIFDRFVRVPGTAGGAGLGLFIAKEVVAAHGGAIGVDSTPGQGATFWFQLPDDRAGLGRT
jgi:two-component system, NtrC family, sensor histidine kinase KinB